MESTQIWLVTLGILSAVIAVDLLLAIVRRNSVTTVGESAAWTGIYVSAAIIFGLLLPRWVDSPTARPEFFAGWLTEYALSVDNIFVFVVILARLKIEKEKQQLVLLLGIMIALVLRGGFIAAGSAIISRFQGAFFIFGAFLIFTAYQLFSENPHNNEEKKESKIEKRLREKGTSTFTVALLTLGVTDLVFALDSIPAIFGITKDPYIVATANIFALMGLRQLYFLLQGLVARLVYLSKGLSFILAFIGTKMIFEAFHAVGVDEIAGVHIPEVPLALSLGVIITSLTITTVASLTATRDDGSEIV
ncbi:MAG: TerC family protein [Actinobacteria bacterium]|nr:TerC family protein [Actinomycetota bacterium]